MASHCPTDAVKKKLPIALLFVALLAPAAPADDVSASAPAAREQCLNDRDARERPSRECESVQAENTADEARAHRRHLLHDAQILELQVLGYGLMLGLAGKLAGRSFWRWFGIGVLIRVVVAALVLLPV